MHVSASSIWASVEKHPRAELPLRRSLGRPAELRLRSLHRVLPAELACLAHLVVDYKDGVRKMVRQITAHEDVMPLRDGPSKGLVMHPSIAKSNARKGANAHEERIKALQMPT